MDIFIIIVVVVSGALSSLIAIWNDTYKDDKITRFGWIAISLLIVSVLLGIKKEYSSYNDNKQIVSNQILHNDKTIKLLEKVMAYVKEIPEEIKQDINHHIAMLKDEITEKSIPDSSVDPRVRGEWRDENPSKPPAKLDQPRTLDPPKDAPLSNTQTGPQTPFEQNEENPSRPAIHPSPPITLDSPKDSPRPQYKIYQKPNEVDAPTNEPSEKSSPLQQSSDTGSEKQPQKNQGSLAPSIKSIEVGRQ